MFGVPLKVSIPTEKHEQFFLITSQSINIQLVADQAEQFRSKSHILHATMI